jgi:hypothetical protein
MASSSTADMFKCCACGEMCPMNTRVQVQSKDAIMGNCGQERCKGCNALKSRISRIMKGHNEDLEGYAGLIPDERKELYKKAQQLCGADLQKLLTECIVNATIRRISDTKTTQGTFEPVDEVTEDWGKRRPTMLQHLLTNGTRMTCPTTKAELIWVPIYTMQIETSNTHEETKKRKLESDQIIKKAKVTKAEPADGLLATKGELPKGGVAKPLSEPQLKRIKALSEKVDAKKMQYFTTQVRAHSPEMTEIVPSKVLENFSLALDLLGTLAGQADDFDKSKQASTIAFKALFVQHKDCFEQLDKFQDVLDSCMEVME